MLRIDGVRYSLRSSELLSIAKITNELIINPHNHNGIHPTPNMNDSVSVYTLLGSVERIIGLVEDESMNNQQCSK